jgi:hypothetical protein
VLLLHAALAGIALPKLALLEPPLALEDEPDGSDLGGEVAELVAVGRRADAVEHFNKSIGVPEEMLAGMRDAPFWPTLEQAAHTLVYDITITSSLPLDRASEITTPVLLLTSEGSDERLPTWGRWLRDTLPNVAAHARGRVARGRARCPRSRAGGVLHPGQQGLAERAALLCPEQPSLLPHLALRFVRTLLYPIGVVFRPIELGDEVHRHAPSFKVEGQRDMFVRDQPPVV